MFEEPELLQVVKNALMHVGGKEKCPKVRLSQPMSSPKLTPLLVYLQASWFSPLLSVSCAARFVLHCVTVICTTHFATKRYLAASLLLVMFQGVSQPLQFKHLETVCWGECFQYIKRTHTTVLNLISQMNVKQQKLFITLDSTNMLGRLFHLIVPWGLVSES